MSGQQFANAKYRNWVKAALGYKYVKEGIEPVCDDIVKQQHADIVKKVNQTYNVSTSNCGQCNLWTLQPDHVRTKYKQCPLAQKDCNCQHPGRTVACPNNVCGAIYDEITNLHASTPPSPCWKNTDVKLWCSQPWAIAKCFINAPGYSQKSTASEIDCSGLLHILINNKGLWKHIYCNITGTDVFSKVRQHRNTIFHSENMEIEDADVVTYIDDMIAVLQDSKELKHRNESKSAVKELLQLKQHDFIITASLEAEVKAAKTALAEMHEELGLKFKNETERTVLNAKSEIEQKCSDVMSVVDQKGSDVMARVEQKGSDVMATVDQKGSEVQAVVTKKGSEVKADVDKKGLEVKAEVNQKCSDVMAMVDHKGSDVVARVEQTGSDAMATVDQKGSDVMARVEQKGSDAIATVDRKGSDVMARVEQTGKRMINQLQDNSDEWSESHKKRRCTDLKKEFQTKLVKLYNEEVTKISPLPLLPAEDCSDILDIYVPPLMTIERRDGRHSTESTGTSRGVETQLKDVHDIFNIEGKPVKLIYVLGEAGSGKSSFCKYLVRHWCVAHSGQSSGAANKQLVEEMKNFPYLFYFSLRHLSDYHSIKDILKEVYQDDILDKVLQNESKKCLIVLDGLDEWTPQGQRSSQFSTKGLPYRDASKDYTILTTSRPWKCSSLQIKKSEMDQTIKLKGIDEDSVKLLIKKMVDILNNKFQKMKDADTCSIEIKDGPVSEIRHVPMLLQQMICLWFDDKLKDTSKCAVYSSMIELFCEWAAKKDTECEKSNPTFSEMASLELPECLTNYEACCDNKHVIISLSLLAYETLLVKSQENFFTPLTFTSSTLKRLNFPNDMKIRSLHTGILSEDRAITLHASGRQQSSFSFIHKSVQEYLAAAFIAIQFENMTKSLGASDQNDEIGKKCLIKYLVSCRTVDDILEQANVLTMLCGLKPQLIDCISKYIYDIVAVDGRVKDYRTTISLIEPGHDFYENCNNDQLITDIQSCIMSCLKEARSSARSFQSRIYIGDIIMSDYDNQFDEITLAMQNKNIVLDSVTSLVLYQRLALLHVTEDAIETLIHCKNLTAFRYLENLYLGVQINYDSKVAAIFVNNVYTLQMLDIQLQGPFIDVLLKHLPTMHNLTSLRIEKESISWFSLSHEQCISLSRWITQTTRLREISVGIGCEQYDEHVVNLSKHKQLQHIEFIQCFKCDSKLNTDKLVTCIVTINSIDEIVQMFDSLYKARNLKYLDLSINHIWNSVVEWRNVTASVIRLLPSLTSLSTLKLRRFTFTDNIFTCPAEIKNLKEIEISDVVMSETTWYKFIDCLPELPQTVKVDTFNLKITLDGKECDMGYHDRPIATETVFRYVREETSLFRVTMDMLGWFKFFALKSGHEFNS